jgi:hypothetical protein
MPTIESYEVTEPPTSGEVIAAALDNLAKAAAMTVTLMTEREVPPPEEVRLSFFVKHARVVKDGNMLFSGPEEETGNWLNILAYQDPSIPAYASYVHT